MFNINYSFWVEKKILEIINAKLETVHDGLNGCII